MAFPAHPLSSIPVFQVFYSPFPSVVICITGSHLIKENFLIFVQLYVSSAAGIKEQAEGSVVC